MKLSPQNTLVGFIGIGVMGKAMAGHLLKAGYSLNIFTRTKTSAQDLLDLGAHWKESPAEVASSSSVVITMVGAPADVESVYLGPNGILGCASKGTYVVDMTTSSPLLASKIHFEAAKKGIFALDAPVSGGDVGAREARLSIMVGGDKDVFDAMQPIFECMGKTIVYQGLAGSGQHTKIANQIAIAANIVGVCEALAYAQKSGLDPDTVLKSISGGAAGSWSLSNLAPRILAGNFGPGFYVRHFIKDLTIALDSAQSMGLDMPGLSLAKQLYERLAAKGWADMGTQSLFKLYC